MFSPEVGFKERNHFLRNLWGIQIFKETENTQSLHFFVRLWPSVSPWRWPKLKKINISMEKLKPSGYPNIAKLRSYLWLTKYRKINALTLSPFQEKYDYLLLYFGNFLQKRGVVTRSRVALTYCSLAIREVEFLIFLINIVKPTKSIWNLMT